MNVRTVYQCNAIRFVLEFVPTSYCKTTQVSVETRAVQRIYFGGKPCVPKGNSLWILDNKYLAILLPLIFKEETVAWPM